jgi:hypothetical protein
MENCIRDLTRLGEDPELDDNEDKIVVRLSRSYWHDNSGFYHKISLKKLKRKSSGYCFIEEDAMNIGFEEIYKKIINIEDCKDGIYVIETCNEKRDWESGDVDDYDYKLVPFIEEEKK